MNITRSDHIIHIINWIFCQTLKYSFHFTLLIISSINSLHFILTRRRFFTFLIILFSPCKEEVFRSLNGFFSLFLFLNWLQSSSREWFTIFSSSFHLNITTKNLLILNLNDNSILLILWALGNMDLKRCQYSFLIAHQNFLFK